MSRRSSQSVFPDGAVDHLRGVDPVLREIIDRVGPFAPSLEPDPWWSLVDAIGSQQLSVKAAATIVGRIAELGQGVRPGPEAILATPEEQLRACGLSGAKVRYVRDLASKWLDGTLQPQRWPELPDEELIAELVQVKGIGRWTAEMLLMFSLGRPDVLPVDDLALGVAMQRAYGLPDRPKKLKMEEIGSSWRPFRTVASLYLWRSLRVPSPGEAGLETA
jgi:DNA-3-methyladenine glycosylase II